jgi:hypothetical protein
MPTGEAGAVLASVHGRRVTATDGIEDNVPGGRAPLAHRAERRGR